MLHPFYRWGTWDLKGLSNFSKVTKPVRSRPGSFWLSRPNLHPHLILPLKCIEGMWRFGYMGCSVWLAVLGLSRERWAHLFFFGRSVLLQIRVNSASWVPVAFKICIKEPLLAHPSPPCQTCTLKQPGQLYGQQAFETSLLRTKIYNPDSSCWGLIWYLGGIYFSSWGRTPLGLLTNVLAAQSAWPAHRLRCSWSGTGSHLFIL